MDFQDLPQDAQDRIAAHERKAYSIHDHFLGRAEALMHSAEQTGSEINSALAIKHFDFGRNRAALELFVGAARECLQGRKLNVARVNQIAEWVQRLFVPDQSLVEKWKKKWKKKCRRATQYKPASEPAAAPDVAPGPFPKRGAWAKKLLEKRGLKKSHLKDYGGPDHHTVQSILNGNTLRDGTLESFVNAVNARSEARSKKPPPKVTIEDVPEED